MTKILIVDDDGEAISGFDKYVSLTVFTAGNEKAAIKITEEEKPAIIIINAGLNEKSGFDTLRKIKRIDGTALVIMMTDRINRDFAMRSFKSGAYDYISTPLDFEYIERIIKTVRCSKSNE
ncbi:MAG: putative transcriptional regulatory protein TcrX [Smithella sp. PtaU1.Bin162]|nr:MAG: putative transcriptional regulatory protein TcrX [Smithella sp. PtaU1.Bin162]